VNIALIPDIPRRSIPYLLAALYVCGIVISTDSVLRSSSFEVMGGKYSVLFCFYEKVQTP